MTGTAPRDTDSARPPRPGAAAPRPYAFPGVERGSLSNGIPIVVSPVRKLPLVTVYLLVDAGAVSEPTGLDGVAQLTARLLLEDGEAGDASIAEQFEALGASVDAHADWDAAVVSVTVLREHLREALRLFRHVVRSPAFPAREVERLKAERLADLLQMQADPRSLADEGFARAVYHESSRFARLDGGTRQSVSALDDAEVRSFYDARYQPGAMTVIVTGDVDAADARSMLDETLGDWRGDSPPRSAAIDLPATTHRAVHVVHKPDAAQTELRIGHVGIPRAHPDYFAVMVMNAVLGGLFSSRINLNLREAHGYTYGAFSGFEWRRQSGPFVVSTAVKSEVTHLAAREILQEIDRIRSQEIARDELSLATSYLDGVFPIRFETTDAIAGALASQALYELPPDYFDTYRERVLAVTPQEILQAAQRYLHPEMLQIVAAGDAGTILEPLTELGAGEVSLHQPGS